MNSETASSSSPLPCGKICSYEFDSTEEGKYYPLLHKSVNCQNIFHRMAHSPYPIVTPPPRRPPPTLFKNFTINGQCPISYYSYYDQRSSVKNAMRTLYEAVIFQKLLELENISNINTYNDRNVVKPLLLKYKYLIQGKRVAVIGTERPWAEAMLINIGAGEVVTIEYRQLTIEHERVTIITPYDMAERFMSGQAVAFDTVFTYSSIEHSGLGRYGDPLTPFGDLEASAQVWCMVKPGGHFILAVPVSDNRAKCSIVWNAHRVYGDARLKHLTANWRVLDVIRTHDVGRNCILVLQKTIA